MVKLHSENLCLSAQALCLIEIIIAQSNLFMRKSCNVIYESVPINLNIVIMMPLASMQALWYKFLFKLSMSRGSTSFIFSRVIFTVTELIVPSLCKTIPHFKKI